MSDETTELKAIMDEFEHECFMLRVEASETRARDDVVRKAYERIRDEFAGRIAATLGSDRESELQSALNKAAGNWAKADALLRERTSGTLTAEQVEKAIHDCSTYASYDGCTYYASGIRLQAIADELNARAERTCHNTHENRWFKCSACGYGFTDLYAEDEGDIDEQPRYCPNCGAKVVDA